MDALFLAGNRQAIFVPRAVRPLRRCFDAGCSNNAFPDPVSDMYADPHYADP